MKRLGASSEVHHVESRRLLSSALSKRDDADERLSAGDCREAFSHMLDSQKWISEASAHMSAAGESWDNDPFARNVRRMAGETRDRFRERCVLAKAKRR